jgi:hypothetical protein
MWAVSREAVQIKAASHGMHEARTVVRRRDSRADGAGPHGGCDRGGGCEPARGAQPSPRRGLLVPVPDASSVHACYFSGRTALRVLSKQGEAGRALLLSERAVDQFAQHRFEVGRVTDPHGRARLVRSGHEVDLTLSGPVNADNVDPWRIVSDSLAWR